MTDNNNQDTSRENGESDISKEVSTALEDVIQKPGEDLGIAGRLTKSFIHSPLSPLFYFALLGLGFMGMMFTPRQEDPQISVPMVDIFVSYPGASSSQVASMVANPLEKIMSEIQGIEHVYSASQRGNAMVTVQFQVGEDMGESLVKMYDKLESNKDKIPPGATPPLVKPKPVDDVPAVTLTLWSTELGDDDLRLLSLDVMQQLKAVKDTSQAFITGGRSEQIRIEADPARIAGFNLTLDQLAQTISSANGELNAGTIEKGRNSFKVYTGSFLKTARDIENLVIGTQDGSVVYVRDVANVIEGPEETSSLVNFYTGPAYPGDTSLVPDGAPAVTIAVAKKQGSNGVDVANNILAEVEKLKGRLIPDNVNVTVTRNYGQTANDKVNSLILKLFFVTGCVTLLIWFFLGFKASMVVLIVIPNVILVTVFTAWVLGFTIDRVSLFALIFSIGILVDDAIVVIENIYRRWLEEGAISTETAVDAVREVGNPTILATFTVIAALLPMGAVSGMMGPYMMPIPVLGSAAMLFSLFAAFVFTPYLAMRLRPTLKQLKKAEKKEHEFNERIEGFFRITLTALITSKTKGRLFLISLFVVFFACMTFFYFQWTTVKIMPLDNKAEFNIQINMPEGTSLPETSNVAFRMTKALQALPEVIQLQSYVGTSSPFNFNGLVRHSYLRMQPWEADIQVELLDKGDRKKTSHELALEARIILEPLAEEMGARIQVVEMPPGPPVLQTMVAEIYGPDDATRRQFARDMENMFHKAEFITDVDTMMTDDYDVWHFEIDREKAVRRGVSVEAINRNLNMAMGDFKLGDIKVDHILEPRYIVMQVPLSQRSQLHQLDQLPIPAASGTTVPLAELGTFVLVKEDPIIFHKDLRPVEFVTGEMIGDLAAPVYGIFDIMRQVENYTAPDGVKPDFSWYGTPEDTSVSTWEWTGEWTVTWETFRDMGGAFMAAIILIYMLVVWEFGNFIMPAIIISPIPLTLIGIVPGHALMGKEFTATSMIGFIALAGIIVRNSILLVDYSREMVSKGHPVSEAVILACKTRTRPIVITALALVMGSLFILTDPIFNGMAITLMFGVIVSTFLTLLVIPLGCITASSSFNCGANITDPLLSGSQGIASCESEAKEAKSPARTKKKTSLGDIGMKVWAVLFTIGSTIFFAIRAIYLLIKNIFDQRKRKKQTAAQQVARKAEADRKADIDRDRKVEAERKAEAERKVEADRKADLDRDRKVEADRKAEVKRKVETDRKAELKAEAERKVEADRKADLDRDRKVEADRKAEVKRKVETDRKAELKAEAEQKAELDRKTELAAEVKRQAEVERKTQAAKKKKTAKKAKKAAKKAKKSEKKAAKKAVKKAIKNEQKKSVKKAVKQKLNPNARRGIRLKPPSKR